MVERLKHGLHTVATAAMARPKIANARVGALQQCGHGYGWHPDYQEVCMIKTVGLRIGVAKAKSQRSTGTVMVPRSPPHSTSSARVEDRNNEDGWRYSQPSAERSGQRVRAGAALSRK